MSRGDNDDITYIGAHLLVWGMAIFLAQEIYFKVLKGWLL